MSELNLLNLAFLENQPGSAARVLQRVDAEDTASFLEDVPLRVVVPVMGKMEAWPAAKILSLMDRDRAAGIVHKLAYQDAAALLRLQDETTRQHIMAGLPTKLAGDFARTLAYPAATVGAWMDTTIPYFQTDLSAQECLELIRAQQRAPGTLLSVVDSNRILQGVVELDALLVADGASRLGQLAKADLEALSANVSLQTAKVRPEWQQYTVLPVIDRRKTYLGSLSRGTLMEALADGESGGISLGHSLFGHLTRAFLVSTAGLLQVRTGAGEERP